MLELRTLTNQATAVQNGRLYAHLNRHSAKVLQEVWLQRCDQATNFVPPFDSPNLETAEGTIKEI
jgi:hypothetical protein